MESNRSQPPVDDGGDAAGRRSDKWVRALRSVILGSIAVGAAVAIVALLGVDVGDAGWKIIVTAFSITGAALVSLPPVAARERRGASWLALVGVGASVAGFALLILFLWVEPSSDDLWKVPTSLIIVAVGISAASLLEFARLQPRAEWVLRATRALLGVAAVMLIIGIWAEIDGGGYWRAFGGGVRVAGGLPGRSPGAAPCRPGRRVGRFLSHVWGREPRDDRGANDLFHLRAEVPRRPSSCHQSRRSVRVPRCQNRLFRWGIRRQVGSTRGRA